MTANSTSAGTAFEKASAERVSGVKSTILGCFTEGKKVLTMEAIDAGVRYALPPPFGIEISEGLNDLIKEGKIKLVGVPDNYSKSLIFRII